ncbi:MAG: DUF1653 domain-containing protein [Oscillospiraceae bacterium]|nr:DUF1653 domain-containing protein [Oscillospiraceae bacterium]
MLFFLYISAVFCKILLRRLLLAFIGEYGVWVRPASMWNETVERDGRTCQRFTYIGESEKQD